MTKNLIVYFSRRGQNYVNGSLKNLTVGNTEVAARMIHEAVGGDMFHIQPVEEYAHDYDTCIDEAKADLRSNARPAFKEPLADIDEYDTIYLGYPNYWGTMPMHVFTFLEKYDFTGKVIKPLCTHEGSGLGRSVSDIQKLCPGATVEAGLAVQGGRVDKARKTIEGWV